MGYRLDSAAHETGHADALVPCQVALTGGPGEPRESTYLLVSVGPALRHDHSDAGAILMMSKGDTCLLGTNGYLQRELLYHNLFYVQPAEHEYYPDDRHGRVVTGDPKSVGRLEEYRAGDGESYCRISIDQYMGMPLSLCREIIVNSDGSVIIVDRARALEDGLQGGPIYHAERIRRISNLAFRLRIERLRSMNGLEVRNAPGSLNVELLTPVEDIDVRRLGSPSVYTDNPFYQTYPCNHYTKIWARSYTARKCLFIKRDLGKDVERVFVTRLSTV